MDIPKARKRFPLVATLIETFGFSPGVALAVSLFLSLLCLLAVLWVVRSAPPRTLYLTSGPEGSSSQRWAASCKDALAKHGVTLEVLPSASSFNNLDRMLTVGPFGEKVVIGFIPGGGVAKDQNIDGLRTLSSIGYPLLHLPRGQPAHRQVRIEQPAALRRIHPFRQPLRPTAITARAVGIVRCPRSSCRRAQRSGRKNRDAATAFPPAYAPNSAPAQFIDKISIPAFLNYPCI